MTDLDKVAELLTALSIPTEKGTVENGREAIQVLGNASDSDSDGADDAANFQFEFTPEGVFICTRTWTDYEKL